MTWATTVGVDGGGRRATTWVMMWAMWTTGTMATKMVATTPATTLAKGMAGTPAGRGGGLLTEDATAAVAAAAATAAAALLFVTSSIFFRELATDLQFTEEYYTACM
jgi:hypothetical protein